MSRFLGVLAVLCLIAFGALAATTEQWNNCDGGSTLGTGAQELEGVGNSLCWAFDNTDDSADIYVKTDEAEFCFDPATDSDGSDSATVSLRYCGIAAKPGSNPTFSCVKVSTPLGTTTFTGGAGAECQVIPRGHYYVDVLTNAGTDDAIARFVGR